MPLDSHQLSPAARATMRKVKDAGVTIAVATARPYEAVRELFLDLGLTELSIFDGGASILNVATGELRWQNWLTSLHLQQMADILLPHPEMADFFPEYKMLPATNVTAESITESAPYAWARS